MQHVMTFTDSSSICSRWLCSAISLPRFSNTRHGGPSVKPNEKSVAVANFKIRLAAKPSQKDCRSHSWAVASITESELGVLR